MQYPRSTLFGGSALFVTSAHAQTSASPDAPAGAGGGALVFVIVMVALFATIAVVVKAMDRRRRRNEEGVHLQARIADAVLLDPALMKLPVSANVRVPFWRATPVTVDAHGEVPTPTLREKALNLVIREASTTGLRFRVVDKLSVAPGAIRRAA
jgi:hypothetical protein